MTTQWCTKEVNNIYKNFNTDQNGLNSVDVEKNREEYGPNILETRKKVTLFEIFLTQFQSAFIYVLIIAAVIILFLGEYLDGGIIIAVILLNAIIGTFQEGKARDTLAALQKVVKSYATVIRDGKTVVIPGDEVVCGDIILLKDGDVVTADARLIEVNRLKVNQSALTGESEPISKDIVTIVDPDTQVADQNNMVFKGTYVISGYGRAVVIATGRDTSIGQVATALDDLKSEMPLETNIRNLSKVIMAIIVFIIIALFVVGIARGISVPTLFLTVVAIAVSAIPESLPVVMTLVLAAGVFRMSQKNALVKRLQAVESLGQARVLALDKTGTITRNQMQVIKLFTDGKTYTVQGAGYEPTGEIMEGDKNISPLMTPSIAMMGRIAAFTAGADIVYDSEKKEWDRKSGDPTEAAMKVLAEKTGLKRDDLEKKYPQVLEIPFDFQAKHHSVVNKIDDKDVLSTAGSPEVLLEWSKYIYKDGKSVKITKEDKEEIMSAIKELSDQGFRVIGGAINENFSEDFDSIDPYELKDMTFVGLYAIQDAIRPQVYEAIKRVKDAGMRAVMITGDHVKTAESIGREIGLFSDGDEVITGYQIDDMSDEKLADSLSNVTIFARVSPHHKLKIIQAYKNRKEIIAMTGDGINDALSLTAADLGVSMGKVGTEVAREASDIILLDDNFDNITRAVLEGRNIYMTIRKTVLYLLSTNIGEVMVISIAVFFGLPLPLLATQIIWLNMVTDTFLVASLALEPRDKDLLKTKFKKPSKYIVDWPMALRILLISSVMTLGTLWLFTKFLPLGQEKAWTISLSTLTAFQWWNIFNIRSNHQSVFKFSLWSNKWLLLSLFVVIVLHLFAIYTPFMQKVLHTTGLNFTEWLLVLGVSLSVILIEELRKFITRLMFNKK